MSVHIVLIISLTATAQAVRFCESTARDRSQVIGEQTEVSGEQTEDTEVTDAFSALQIQTGATVRKLAESSQAPCHQPRPKALFCYAKVRTPPEPTVALLATQLSAACDGWALFGDTDNPAQNVTKAFSRQDSPDVSNDRGSSNPTYDINDSMTRSIWEYLIASGALDDYEWFLKVDSDSFVRPSTLRKNFKALHTSCRRNPISSQHDGVDGFFIAVQADTILAIKSFGWLSECSIVLSGDVWTAENHDKDIPSCLGKIGIPHVERMTDAKGNYLLALDQDPMDSPMGIARGPKKCENMAKMLLDRASQNIEGPVCGCSTLYGEAPGCVSEDFVTVHHVKDALVYSKLVEAFP